MKQWISVLLAVVMLLALASCGSEPDAPAETSPSADSGGDSGTGSGEETDEWGQTVIDNEIPEDLDYGGETVNILVRSGEQYCREWTSDEATDALSNEIFVRNQAVQDELGVVFRFIIEDEGNRCETINQRIINVGKSGLGGIDIVNNYSAYAANPNLLENYINLYDSRLTYLNLDK